MGKFEIFYSSNNISISEEVFCAEIALIKEKLHIRIDSIVKFQEYEFSWWFCSEPKLIFIESKNSLKFPIKMNK